MTRPVKSFLQPTLTPALTAFSSALAQLNDWQDEPIHDVIINTAEQHHLKMGKLAQPIRVAITGNTVSPPLNTTLRLLGKTRSIKRLEAALNYITTQSASPH